MVFHLALEVFAGALVSKPIVGVDVARLVVVKDVEKALQALGAVGRVRSTAKVWASLAVLVKPARRKCWQQRSRRPLQ